MTNAELAKLLNAQVGLAGTEAVTPNVIRQWVAWKVMPKAAITGRLIDRGPAWSRPGAAMRRASRLAEMRKLGVTRRNALIVQAYVEWGHPDFDRVRQALVREEKKWRAQLVRHRTTHIDRNGYADLSSVKKSAIRTQLGPLDSQFVGTQFQQTEELYATAAQLAESGEGGTKQLNLLLLDAVERTVSGIGQLLPSGLTGEFSKSIAGLLGSENEILNSAQFEIERATEREFRIARAALRCILRTNRKAERILTVPEIGAEFRGLLEMQIGISPQVSAGQWTALQFIQCILSVRRGVKCPEISLNPADSAKLMHALFPRFAIPKA